ncbi:PREDICTED: uncharacterized protein LOC104595054 isoform X3 [Nelumbo nucifera]|uniref:Uncharacterized protein LOC104595054 isoform X3 n=1 Tax=Nelumbo nucifera TaxID=4432 RepID=A0A1U7ZXN3_NELNU|nr:PREDICTED: uncharacterized protein LOC104595054 isoform X3 [Nelumbo nucifera]
MTRTSLDLRTTAQVIKQSSASFLSGFYTFLFLSFLLFSFRTVVESGTLFVTSFIDRDPSLKSLLSRLDLAGKNVRSPESFKSPTTMSRRRRPFLHLSRVGTLDDDFFSGDDDEDRSLFGLGRPAPVNRSFLNLSHFFRGEGKLGFLDSEKGDGIRFSEIVGSGFLFKAEGFSLNADIENEGEDNGERNMTTIEEKGEEGDRPADFQLLVKGLELGRRDAATLFFLASYQKQQTSWQKERRLLVIRCKSIQDLSDVHFLCAPAANSGGNFHQSITQLRMRRITVWRVKGEAGVRGRNKGKKKKLNPSQTWY